MTCTCIVKDIYRKPQLEKDHGIGCPLWRPTWARRYDLPGENKPIRASKELVR
jgi:hypothetical protein